MLERNFLYRRFNGHWTLVIFEQQPAFMHRPKIMNLHDGVCKAQILYLFTNFEISWKSGITVFWGYFSRGGGEGIWQKIHRSSLDQWRLHQANQEPRYRRKRTWIIGGLNLDGPWNSAFRPDFRYYEGEFTIQFSIKFCISFLLLSNKNLLQGVTGWYLTHIFIFI